MISHGHSDEEYLSSRISAHSVNTDTEMLSGSSGDTKSNFGSEVCL